MKTKKSKPVILMSVVATLFIIAGSPLGAEESKPTLSKKELKRLIALTKTAEDHHRLAAYYRQKAQYLTDQQKKYEEMAIEYDKSPRSYPTKYPTAAACCRNWAAWCAQRAKQAQALAARHEEKAKWLRRRSKSFKGMLPLARAKTVLRYGFIEDRSRMHVWEPIP
jgi:hypothetical protein